METGLKQSRLWISVWVSGVVVLLRMSIRCAGAAAKGVARSSFPCADERRQAGSPALSPMRAASCDRMRFFALALLCRKR